MSDWIRHITLNGLDLPEDDSYISFGLASELGTECGQFRNSESLMHFLVTDMFKARFDPPPQESVPAIYAADRAAMRTPMLIPQISLPDNKSNSVAFISHGWGNGSRQGVVTVLHTLRTLPFSIPETSYQSAYDELATYPFFRYPETAQDYLLNINVRKHVLQVWFEERGLTPPWNSPTGNNIETMEIEFENIADLPTSNVVSKKPGRPASKLWDFILSQGSKIRNEKPEMLNKCLAGKVQDIARAEFPDAEIPALATIQKHLSRNGLSRYSHRKH